MSGYRDRADNVVALIRVSVAAADLVGRDVWFGGFSPDSSERQILRGNVFAAIMSDTFGNAR